MIDAQPENIHVNIDRILTGERIAELNTTSDQTVQQLIDAAIQRSGHDIGSLLLGDTMLENSKTLKASGFEDGSVVKAVELFPLTAQFAWSTPFYPFETKVSIAPA